MHFYLDNVDYQITLSTLNSEDDGVSIQLLKAELVAGQKKVVVEKIIRDGHVDYKISGEGPEMDDEAERKRFLSSWAVVVFGQIQRHNNEDGKQDDQMSRSLASFLQLYKHFFEPRLMSLLQEEALDRSENDEETDGFDSSDSSDDGNVITSSSKKRKHDEDFSNDDDGFLKREKKDQDS